MPGRRVDALSSSLLDVLNLRAPFSAGDAARKRSAPPRRVAGGADVRHSVGAHVHIPDAARAGMRSAALFETMDSTEEVAGFLGELGLRKYASHFRSHGVTGNTLLSLNSVELRDTLGVAVLRDRRVILDGIHYLAQALGVASRATLPEDGRILTHLSNEVTVLAWFRFCIVIQTVAVASLRLTNLVNMENDFRVVVTSSIVSALSGVTCLYACYRYYWNYRMIESPGLDFSPDDMHYLAPSLIVGIFTVVVAYAFMAQGTEEAAMLVLLGV